MTQSMQEGNPPAHRDAALSWRNRTSPLGEQGRPWIPPDALSGLAFLSWNGLWNAIKVKRLA